MKSIAVLHEPVSKRNFLTALSTYYESLKYT